MHHETELSETLSARLRKAHLRATHPRLLVLQLLQEIGGHRTIDELVHELQERGTPLPRSSVYKVIATLVERGLVMQADAGPGHALYEVSVAWHHHFVCVACGIVVDIPCVKGEKPCCFPIGYPASLKKRKSFFAVTASNVWQSNDKAADVKALLVCVLDRERPCWD